MTRTLITALAAFAALAVAAPASAKEAGHKQTTVTVRIAAYDLDTPRGAERFAGVLQRAVARACDAGDRTLVGRRLKQECISEMMGDAAMKIDKPYVYAALGQPVPGRIVLAAR